MKLMLGILGLILIMWSLSKLRQKTGEHNFYREMPEPVPEPEGVLTKKQSKQVIAINDISIIWSKRKEAKIRLEELALLWRNTQKHSHIEEKIHFFNSSIQDFYKKHLENKPFFTGNTRRVIVDLLTLLDTEGNVSSVVSGQNETESKLPSNTYQMLAQVSLAEHSIHVAEEILTIVPFGPNIPKAVIAALGHDIGKIPKYRNQYYSIGDHPFISITVLDSLQSFKELIYADDILKAIRDHHLKPKDYLGEALKEADQRARRRELTTVQRLIQIAPPTQTEREQSDPNVPVENSVFEESAIKEPEIKLQSKPEPTLAKQHFPHQNQTFEQTLNEEQTLMGESSIPEIFILETEKTKQLKTKEPSNGAGLSHTAEIFFSFEGSKDCVQDKPKELELTWFNVNEFLNCLLDYVNVLIGGRWLACSMPNGIVYVQPRLMWTILKELAKKKSITDILFAENDEDAKRNYLYTVLKQIQYHKNAVETSLIQEGYFSAPFVVKMKSGERYRMLYIPLRATEAFGVSVGELESRKKDRLKEIESISPPYESETS